MELVAPLILLDFLMTSEIENHQKCVKSNQNEMTLSKNVRLHVLSYSARNNAFLFFLLAQSPPHNLQIAIYKKLMMGSLRVIPYK